VFAPTNDAFKKIPNWLKEVIKDKNALKDLLLYHVLAQKVMFADITDETSVKTLNGKPIRLNIGYNNGVVSFLILCKLIVVLADFFTESNAGIRLGIRN
jgi:uncharacterized surface protein with fasciclin (FAS1) repeats